MNFDQTAVDNTANFDLRKLPLLYEPVSKKKFRAAYLRQCEMKNPWIEFKADLQVIQPTYIGVNETILVVMYAGKKNDPSDHQYKRQFTIRIPEHKNHISEIVQRS